MVRSVMTCPMDKAILRQWPQAGSMDKHVLYPTETGVPQGGVASSVLMNLALNGLESYLKETLPARRQTAGRPSVSYHS